MIVTVYENIFSDKPYKQKAISVLERFKTDDLNISALKNLSKEDLSEKKKYLPAVCFAGIFERRSKDGFKQASGLMVLDFDNVNAIEVKQALAKDTNCYSAFVSPSG